MSKEIERKFLVDDFSDAMREKATRMTIEQGYLALEEEEREVRLRKADNIYLLTVKSAGDLERAEYEVKLDSAQFEVLWPATEGRRLEKDRYLLERDGVAYEIDIYDNPLRGLMVAEIEFTSEEEARAFEPPAWLGREVTELSFLKNRRLLNFESYEELKRELQARADQKGSID